MRKGFLLLLVLFFTVGIFNQSFADRNVSTTKAYSASTLIKSGDWKIYRIVHTATANGGSFAIYDNLAGGNNTNIKTEGSEATSLNGKIFDFTNKPLEGSSGLYLVVTTSNVVVEYE